MVVSSDLVVESMIGSDGNEKFGHLNILTTSFMSHRRSPNRIGLGVIITFLRDCCASHDSYHSGLLGPSPNYLRFVKFDYSRVVELVKIPSFTCSVDQALIRYEYQSICRSLESGLTIGLYLDCSRTNDSRRYKILVEKMLG